MGLKCYLFLVHPRLSVLNFGELNKGKSTRGTCLFFADETNVLGHQSTTLDVVADVRFRDVLSKASDHDCVVGWYISAFLLTVRGSFPTVSITFN